MQVLFSFFRTSIIHRLIALFLITGMLIPDATLWAQTTDCKSVLAALDAAIAPNTCQTVELDTICYGNKTIQADLRKRGIVFQKPNDRASITDISSLKTTSMAGAAILYASTNEAPIKLIVFGDAQLLPKSNQIYTLRKTNDQLLCTQTPSGMMLQTRKGTTGQITINDVIIRLGSTAFVSIDPLQQQLFALNATEQKAIRDLMVRWDQIHIKTLREVSTNELNTVLTGEALQKQITTINTLRTERCYWEVTEVEPLQVIAIEGINANQAKAYIVKNRDMDNVCRGRRDEQADLDGNYVGVYLMERVNGQWLIHKRTNYDIAEGESPTRPVSGRVDVMTISNVEGSVTVTVLDTTITLAPGQQVRIALANDRPVDVVGPVADNLLPQSPVITWLAVNANGLPLVNKDVVNQAVVLPAPLYYLGRVGSVSQIFRIERDGVTTRQVTDEPQGVDSSFDVSPLNGNLIYVSNNNLIQIDSRGNNRVIKARGGVVSNIPTTDPEAIMAYHKSILAQPVFSSDGTQIAFAKGGINIVQAEQNTSPTLVLPNPSVPTGEYSIQVYYPVKWSPNDSKILLGVGHYEGSSLGVFDLNTNGYVDSNVYMNGDTFWLDDDKTILTAEKGGGGYGGRAGLYKLNSTTGQVTSVIIDKSISNPLILKDENTVYFFADLNQTQFPDIGISIPLYLYRSSLDLNNPLQLTSTSIQSSSAVLWDKLGKGAVIVENNWQTGESSLFWFSVNGDKTLLSEKNVYDLEWGK